MPSARTTLWTDKRTSALSGNYFTVLFVTWTPETMVILDFSCSVRCPQICDTGCSIRWGAFDPKHQLSTNSRNDWDQRWIGKCRKMVGVVLTKFFILRQIYEHRHISCRTTISVFLDLTQPIGQFFNAVSRLCVPEKFISLIQSLHVNSQRRFRTYNNVLRKFTTRSVARQITLFPPLFFNFFIEMLIKIVISLRGNNGIDIRLDGKLSVFKFVEDVVLPTEDPNKLWLLSIIWMIMQECLTCVLHRRRIECCCMIGLAKGRTLFSQKSNQMRQTDLVTWVVVSHLVVVHSKEYPRAYRRPDWLLLIWGTCYVDVVAGYRWNVEYIRQQ